MKTNVTVTLAAVLFCGATICYANVPGAVSTVVPKNIVVGSADLDNSGRVEIWDVLNVVSMHLGSYRGTRSEFLRADANFNGRIDREDVDLALNACLEIIQLPVYEFKPGDVDGNGAVELFDILKLVDYTLNASSGPFLLYNADVNQDYFIDTQDIDAAVAILLEDGPIDSHTPQPIGGWCGNGSSFCGTVQTAVVNEEAPVQTIDYPTEPQQIQVELQP